MANVKKSLKKASKPPYKANKKATLKISPLMDNKMNRPDFSSVKKKASKLEASLAINKDYTEANLTDKDLAAPHRAPYAKIRDKVFGGYKGQVNKMVKSLTSASKHYEEAFKDIKISSTSTDYHDLADLYGRTRVDVEKALDTYNKHPKNQTAKRTLIKSLNNLASNAPGLGPHLTANHKVSDNLHLQSSGKTDGSLTPRSKAASYSMADLQVAVDNLSKSVVAPSGALQPADIGSHGKKEINGLGSRVFRGSLYVDENSKVYKPKNPFQKPTGTFEHDWELVK